MGHIRDLPAKKLGIDIREHEFIPFYEIISERKKRVSELKKIAGNQKEIILATDPDREGEAIAYHIKEILKNDREIKRNKPVFKRIVFHEITASAINHALGEPKEVDKYLVDAQVARRLLDRLVGYKLSPLLWNKLGKRWLSAGRVQTVAVRLIVEREREIQAFVAVEYWFIDVEFKGEKDQFISRLLEIDGKKAEINNSQHANEIILKLKESSYQISSIETKEVKKSPAPPFTTSTLQQTAVNRFGWSAKKTMRAAQQLYEEGYITYHRTDSTNLAMEAIEASRKFIEKNYGRGYLPDKFRFYKTKSKVAQEAHEAIRPTDINIMQTKPELGRDAQLLYGLIWRRFLACQMTDARADQTTILVEGKYQKANDSNSFLLKTTATQLTFDGWMKLYEKVQFTGNNQNSNGDVQNRIPEVKVNEKIEAVKIIPYQKFTEPPARYNEASLIKALEEKGIGRPSTYAPIISTIQDRKYVEKIERRFHPTDLGFAVCDFLVKFFPNIFEVTFTAGMEDNLDEIANGKLNRNQVLNDFYDPFKTRLDEVFKEADRVKLDLGTTDEICPKCSEPLVVRMSKFGKFLACSTFPSCKYTKNIMEKAGITCPKCGGEIVVKRTKRGKQFYGCGNYPKCTFAAWKKEDIK